MTIRLGLASWFSAAFQTLVDLADIGYLIEDKDVDRLVERATVMEIAGYVDN